MNSSEITKLLREVRQFQNSIDDRLAIIESAIPGDSSPISKVVQIACELWECHQIEVTRPSSTRSTNRVSDCRRAICKYLRDHYPELSVSSIARRTGRKYHTALHHIDEADHMLTRKDPEFYPRYKKLIERLK